MVQPTVAAVVPVYNRPRVVLEALESVAAQTLPPTRLIVVDDGSTDDTAERVEEWIAKARLPFDSKVIRQSNEGAAIARNCGAVEAGECELLAFLDSDDLWPKDYLERMGAAMARHPDAVAAACDRVNFDFATNRSNPHSYVHYENGQRNVPTIIFMDGPPGTPNTVFRAGAFRRLGGYDAEWPTGQDYDLMLRLSLLGRWLYVPGEAVSSRNHTELVKGGGEPPLSRKYPDRAYRRVQMLDRFIHQAGGAAVVPEQFWRGRLSQLWFRAGRRLIALDRVAEARECLRRTLELRPWHLPARLCLLTTPNRPSKAPH